MSVTSPVSFLEAGNRFVDGGGEQVNADQREIARGLTRPLFQADYPSRGVQFGDAGSAGRSPGSA